MDTSKNIIVYNQDLQETGKNSNTRNPNNSKSQDREIFMTLYELLQKEQIFS